MTDLGFFYDWLIIDIKNTGNVVCDPPIWQFCDPKRRQTLVPGGPGRRRWEIMLLPGETAEDLGDAEACWMFMQPRGSNPSNTDLERFAVWRFQAKWANRWTRGRHGRCDDFVPRGWHLIGHDHVPGTDLPAAIKARFEALGGSRISVSTKPGVGNLCDKQGTYAA
jgi:hypothetical protein